MIIPSWLADFQAQFFYDPVGFVFTMWPDVSESIEDWQVKSMHRIGKALEQGEDKLSHVVRSSIVAGHGVGKSAELCWLTQWWLLTRIEAKGVITANTKTQLDTKTWPEMHKWRLRLPEEVQALLTQTGTKLSCNIAPEAWFIAAVPWSEQRPESVAGEHGPYPFAAIDEASAVPKIIHESMAGVQTTGHVLMLMRGNGTRPDGEFYDSHEGRTRHRYIKQSVDVRDCRRPGINLDLVNEWLEDFGEDSDFFKIRARGMFPAIGYNSFFSRVDIDEARKRTLDREAWIGSPLATGADVATFGSDSSVIVDRQGLWLPTPNFFQFRGLHPHEFGDKLIDHINKRHPDGVFIDGNGVGAGTCGRLAEFNYRYINVWSSNTLTERQKAASRKGAVVQYLNLRAELAGKVRKWMWDGGSLLHAPDRLVDQMMSILYTEDPSTGLIMLEPKSALRARGEPSPDDFDALSHTFAGPLRPKSKHNRGSYVAKTDFSAYA